jgi:hypothetical protein
VILDYVTHNCVAKEALEMGDEYRWECFDKLPIEYRPMVSWDPEPKVCLVVAVTKSCAFTILDSESDGWLA